MENKILEMQLPMDGVWMPKAASVAVPSVDDPFWLIFWACVITFFLLMAPMVYFIARYKRKTPDQKAESQVDHSQVLEIAWSALPLVFFGVVFYMGFTGYLNLTVPPANAVEVRVTGQKWFWSLDYPQGFTLGGAGETFVMPENTPIKLVMSSKDVLHSFYVPNFRIKQDVIPGRYTTLWFQATEKGEYPIFCTEYCGKDHSMMLGKIKVVSQEEYQKWAQATADAQGGEPTADKGKVVYEKYCKACHTTDGTRLVGPSFKGLAGRQEELTGGTKVEVNKEYLVESIVNPMAKVVNGYPPAMPSFKDSLKTNDIDSVILYIESLK